MTYDVFSHVNEFNPAACADSYKFSHPFLFNTDMTGMTAYVEARVKGRTMIMFGLQAWIKKYLMKPFQQWMIDEVEHDLALHGLPYDKPTWQSIIDNHDGFLPIEISAVPEGMPIPSGNALVTVTAVNGLTHEQFKTLVSWVETSLLRAIWYGSTIATEGYERRMRFKEIYELAGAPMPALDFAYHSFAGRGVTCNEQAENGDMAHLLNWRGTDTFECLRAIRRWYPDGTNPAVSGFSVWAGEHNVALSYGTSDTEETAYIEATINAAKTNANCKILSFVIDTVDWRKCVTKVMQYKEQLLELHAMGKKLVLRPDSDDMQITVPWIMEQIINTFGYTENSKGFKIPAVMGVIQGDGVDTLSAVALMNRLMSVGICPSSIVFGSGGALLQKVSRDDFSFAMKGSAFQIIGDWIGRQKLTPGKVSKLGILGVFRVNGSIVTLNIMRPSVQNAERIDRVVYSYGKLLVDESFELIRSRLF